MIYGIGTDITDIQRIEKAFTQHGKRFAEKLLSEAEMQLFNIAPRPVNFLAKRWAAKEAFGKACGTGIRHPVLFPLISVTNDKLGKPQINTHGTLTNWLKQRHITQQHLSLSDESGMIMAFVVIEKTNSD